MSKTPGPPTCPKCGAVLTDENWKYVRDGGDLGRGWWTCEGCKTVLYPNGDPAEPGPAKFTQGELDRLMALQILFSDDGWGSRFRWESVIACALPVPQLPEPATPVVD